MVEHSAFHLEESFHSRKVLLLHFVQIKTLLLLIVDCCHKFIDIVLLFVQVDVIILSVSIDVQLLDHSILVEQFFLEFSKQDIVGGFESLNMFFVIVLKRNLFSDHSNMRASIVT